MRSRASASLPVRAPTAWRSHARARSIPGGREDSHGHTGSHWQDSAQFTWALNQYNLAEDAEKKEFHAKGMARYIVAAPANGFAIEQEQLYPLGEVAGGGYRPTHYISDKHRNAR